MPETAPIAERPPVKEATTASNGLMLHLANGEFDRSKASSLNKTPIEISSNTFDRLKERHTDVRRQQQEDHYRKLREAAAKDPEFKGEVTPELLKHHHFISWAKVESQRIAFMFRAKKDSPEGQAALVEALGKLHIIIDDNVDVSNLPDQLYNPTSNTSGEPGAFYKEFCTGNSNQKLVNKLSQNDIVVLQDFLIDMLGSKTAYDTLLATKQTQDAITGGHNFGSGGTALNPGEDSILDFLAKGAVKNNLIDQSKPQGIAEKEEEKKKTVSIQIGSATEKGDRHVENEDSFFQSGQMGGIFDGAGGHYRGDLASQAARDAVREVLSTLSPQATLEQAQQVVKKAMEVATQKVGQIPYPQGERPPISTGTIYYLWQGKNGEQKLIFASVGDSRLWIKKTDGTTNYLTRDDNMLKMWASSGQITLENYEEIQRRIDNAKTQEEIKALGRFWNQTDVTAMLGDKTFTGQVGMVDVQAGDMFFLTSDGIHDNLTAGEIESIAKQTTDPQQLAKILIDRAHTVSHSTDFRAKPDDLTAIAANVPSF